MEKEAVGVEDRTKVSREWDEWSGMDLQLGHGTVDVSSQAEMEFRVLTEKLQLLPTIAFKTRCGLD